MKKKKILMLCAIMSSFALLSSCGGETSSSTPDTSDSSIIDTSSETSSESSSSSLDSSLEEPGSTYQISFENGTGYEFASLDGNELPSSITEGETMHFKVVTDSSYDDSALVVYANESPVSAQADGSYSYTPAETTVFTAGGISLLEFDPEGKGTYQDPLVIETVYQLMHLEDSIQKLGTSDFMVVYLANNLNLGGIEWDPLFSDMTARTIYFLGQGHTISNLTITEENESGLYGLFGYYDGYIDGLNLDNVNIDIDQESSTGSYVGALAGYMHNGWAENITVDGNVNLNTIEAYTYVGGVVGMMYAYGYYTGFENTAFEGNVENASVNGKTGGILGYGYTGYGAGAISISNSYVTGSEVSGGYSIGGMIGSATYYTAVTNSYVIINSIKTSVEDGAYAGGIFGSATDETIVLNSYVEANLISSNISTSSYYKSYAGTFYGYSSSGYASGYQDEKSIAANSIYNVEGVNADYYNIEGNETKARTKETFESLGFSSVAWNVTDTPSLTMVTDTSSYTISVSGTSISNIYQSGTYFNSFGKRFVKIFLRFCLN